MNIKVVHCKKSHYDVYIGRPSKWGNPFSIGKDGSREEVTNAFVWKIQQLLTIGTISSKFALNVKPEIIMDNLSKKFPPKNR